MNSLYPYLWISPILILQFALTSQLAQAGQFDEIRSEVNQPPPKEKKKKRKSHDHDHYHHHDDDDDGFGNIFVEFVFGIVAAPFRSRRPEPDIQYEFSNPAFDSQPHRLPPTIEQFGPAAESIDPLMSFAHYPYADDLDGNMMYSDSSTARPQAGSKRLWFEYGSDFDDIDRWTGKFLVEGKQGFALDGGWNYYTERLAPAVQDNLHVGDVNLLFRLVETPKTQWRLGVGMNWFHSREMTDLGLNVTTKVDCYPINPIVFSGEVDYGGVGDAEMFHGGVSVGVIWNHVEIFSGYDYRKIGPVELEGPMFGVRLWW